jgi:PEP-CTERM motif
MKLRFLFLAALAGSAGHHAMAAMSTEDFKSFSDGSAVSAVADISGLKYTLVDLNPNDGIAPSVQFVSLARAGSLYDMLSVARGALDTPTAADLRANGVLIGNGYWGGTLPLAGYPAGQFQGVAMGAPGTTYTEWLPQTALQTASTDGLASASLGAGSLSSVSKITGASINQYRQPDYAETTLLADRWSLESSAESLTGPGGGYVYSVNTDPITDEYLEVFGPGFSGDGMEPWTWPMGQQFILSPQTQIVFEGTLDAQITSALNVTGLADLTVAGVNATATASAVLFRAQPKDGLDIWPNEKAMFEAYDYQSADDFIFLNQYIDTTTGEVLGKKSADQATHKNFSFSLTNAETSAITATLNLVTNATVSANGSVVPEPSTWALMGLGLLGMAGVARRHQPA